jgi:polyhydroxybutyrate depolymerase
VLGLLLSGMLLAACHAPESDDSAADTSVPAAACEAGSRPGATGPTDGLKSADGIAYNVRTPSAYDPVVAWPLIVVYAGANGDPDAMERSTQLTPDADVNGFMIAYADHRSPASDRDVEALSHLPDEIGATWCVDPDRVYLTGHSDGGSVVSLITLEELRTPTPAAVAPSSAGVDISYVRASGCPAPIPVMVQASSGDTLFPIDEGFGPDVAAWWAGCDGCDPTPGAPYSDGCLPYGNCTDGTEVIYCEGTGPHGEWPGFNVTMMTFFGRHPAG